MRIHPHVYIGLHPEEVLRRAKIFFSACIVCTTTPRRENHIARNALNNATFGSISRFKYSPLSATKFIAHFVSTHVYPVVKRWALVAGTRDGIHLPLVKGLKQLPGIVGWHAVRDHTNSVMGEWRAKTAGYSHIRKVKSNLSDMI